MKSTFLPLLICLPSLLLSRAVEADEPADALLEARAATIQLEIEQGQSMDFGRGAFISAEGHALVTLVAVCQEKVPTVLCAGAGQLKFGDILGIFPEHGLALVKFDHRPKSWLKLAREEPEVGEPISLITLDGAAPWAKEVPPIVGPVMAKRSELASFLRVPQFVKVLSLGSGVTWAQAASLTSGDCALDREGGLVAFLKHSHNRNGQLLISLASVVGIAEDVEKMKKNGQRIPHPFDEVDNPLDLVARSEHHPKLMLAMQRGDSASARQAYEKLKRQYPASIAVNLMQFNPILNPPDGPKQLAILENDERPGAEEPQAVRVQILAARAMSIAGDDPEKGIRDLKAAVALSPKDYPNPREALALLYARLGRLEEAEAMYREALECHPESIGLNERFEGLLTKQRAWDELKIVEDRLERLREIYRRK